MTRNAWTPDLDDQLRAGYPNASAAELAAQLGKSLKAIYTRAHKLGLKKPVDWIAERARQRSAQPDHGGRAHRFAQGITPWNKGTHFTAGGRSVETRFKPGQRRGVAVRLYQPIGTERISKDGYLQRKINDDLPLQRRWRGVHILLWEAAHGPLPAGHALVFKDGNKAHIALDNLELITRADLMRRNTFHRYGKEIAAVVQLKGAITRQINRRNRNANDQ